MFKLFSSLIKCFNIYFIYIDRGYLLISVENRILFHKCSKEIDIFTSGVAINNESEIKFDLPPKSTNILFMLFFIKN